MDVRMISRVLWLRSVLRSRERWSRARLGEYQRRRLALLREHAYARSTFYRHFHQGLARAPLAELPVLTKAALMDCFDDLSTDREVRLAEVEEYLETLRGDDRYRGRYWVSATSGSSGRKSIIPSNAREWATVIASYARANEWAGISAGPLHPMGMAVVSSTTAWHQSARVAATVRSPFIQSVRLDAASPLPEIVVRLNETMPEVLVAYASMIRALADEQLAGRLRVAPRAVNASSEVLTEETRAMAARAWEAPPFNVYAATETGGIAAECGHHQGMHLFEDLVIPEVVDENYRPVPPGVAGDRLLVTVLFSRTLPLIRYEMTDRVRLATRPCPCGRPFRLLESIEGRTDDLLTLPAQGGGSIRVHPVVFHQVLDLLDAAGWQVRQEDKALEILVAAPGAGFDPADTARLVQAALASAGALPPEVRVTIVDTIPAGASGKRPLIVAAPGTS
ncbi:phenylacetate--CoA ligase family protein [Nonomuraea basaltis]|uniref:phenylacetate--CoA ligase family protein n=1 Tax=Nonomuraea basaltis TaxID=2495887 RepID=UPI00110C67DD|nr:phenylacetate--CoA ligase family protein [Nonomuraea basaltis]TMS00331.1 phenylacetate--CoA ligase family protein [Nonomuraea basaltis]